MIVKVLKNEEEYQMALSRLEEIFHAPANTPEGDEAELLVLLIEKYEEEFYPIDPPNPLDAIKFRMEQLGMDNKDLADILGYKSRVSELFKGKRKLSLTMIKNLHHKLNIPYESLLSE
ncbi:helix-turn-helix domain-containing protein [Litoribacter ruber]|uniref:Helix-turn-helix domain-containing protein n=1 Tax=Litoribacter ruber TaxID=702568 RepID=A0AAP2G1M2_9BACT|nr:MULTISPECIES: helix-turn-helix domain-containing protein [Litoribacter]MBS9524392.1 helix-turn-helix domain-containing protein [Litoribacter alkaliphilus]MBT0809809.1 helix-turn-helix domain-containing protein [Litoribacter ruber]